MSNKFKEFWFFGLIGGLALSLLDWQNIYYTLNSVFYLLAPGITILCAMLYYKLRHKPTSFKLLLKIGFFVSMIALVVHVIIIQLYLKLKLTEKEKIQLIDEKVDRMIMDFDGNKIDIFAMEKRANDLLGVDVADSVLELLALLPLYLLFCVIFALLLKSRNTDPEEFSHPTTS